MVANDKAMMAAVQPPRNVVVLMLFKLKALM
jgi:hypothetical protein